MAATAYWTLSVWSTWKRLPNPPPRPLRPTGTDHGCRDVAVSGGGVHLCWPAGGAGRGLGAGTWHHPLPGGPKRLWQNHVASNGGGFVVPDPGGRAPR